ncbi:MAG: PilZ domain-containing protein [Candidatus Omnitrophota bacterium]
MFVEILLLVGVWALFLGGFFLFVHKPALDRQRADLLWEEDLSESPWPYERRRYKRRYLPLSVSYGSLEQADSQELTLAYDVGKGGVRFPASHPLRQGSRLYLSIDLPRRSPLSLFGEVVWQAPRSTMPHRYDTGIKFIDLSTANIIKIARHL